MTIELDASNDFAQCMDGLESVTLRRRDSGETLALSAALRRRTTTQEAEPSGGAARQADAVWHVQMPAEEAPPQLGDVLIDAAGIRWTILEVEPERLLGRWKCTARNLSVAFGLDDRVDIQRAEWGDLGEGPVIVDWNFVATAVPVRIQPEETVVSGLLDAPTSVARFTIILGEPFPLGPDDRFVAADGAIYRLESIEQVDRLDVLPVARVVRK
jgi:hypothetical protein